jgi:hypothetical protein
MGYILATMAIFTRQNESLRLGRQGVEGWGTGTAANQVKHTRTGECNVNIWAYIPTDIGLECI